MHLLLDISLDSLSSLSMKNHKSSDKGISDEFPIGNLSVLVVPSAERHTLTLCLKLVLKSSSGGWSFSSRCCEKLSRWPQQLLAYRQIPSSLVLVLIISPGEKFSLPNTEPEQVVASMSQHLFPFWNGRGMPANCIHPHFMGDLFY